MEFGSMNNEERQGRIVWRLLDRPLSRAMTTED
jgi:hypothetical protein